MKREDFEKLFDGFTTENYQEKLLNAKNVLSTENDNYENAKGVIAERDNTISELRDTNQRLFLRVNGTTIDDNKEDEEDVSLEDILKSIKDGGKENGD